MNPKAKDFIYVAIVPCIAHGNDYPLLILPDAVFNAFQSTL